MVIDAGSFWEDPSPQLGLAQAASLIDSAQLYAYRAAAEIDEAAARGTYPDYEARPASVCGWTPGRRRQRPRGHPHPGLRARGGQLRRGHRPAMHLARKRDR
ncbi:hypothetical protein AB0H77_42195 [Streptomyces sp. NPDC050844]|uniref:hypothetical protein n=1 Tax=Streptomyces sp. NPDC050844 TaxID=3155790 RepID=UPI0033CC0922